MVSSHVTSIYFCIRLRLSGFCGRCSIRARLSPHSSKWRPSSRIACHPSRWRHRRHRTPRRTSDPARRLFSVRLAGELSSTLPATMGEGGLSKDAFNKMIATMDEDGSGTVEQARAPPILSHCVSPRSLYRLAARSPSLSLHTQKCTQR